MGLDPFNESDETVVERWVENPYGSWHPLDRLKVWIAGAKRGVTVAIKKKLKRRNAVKPVMGT